MEDEEGARSFARFIENVAEGDAHRELSSDLHELTRKIQSEASAQGRPVTGKLTLTLSFKMEPSGLVAVEYASARKDPTPIRSRGHMFVTPGGNLSVENPRQQKLPGIREVTAPRETRDVTAKEGA